MFDHGMLEEHLALEHLHQPLNHLFPVGNVRHAV